MRVLKLKSIDTLLQLVGKGQSLFILSKEELKKKGNQLNLLCSLFGKGKLSPVRHTQNASVLTVAVVIRFGSFPVVQNMRIHVPCINVHEH